MPLPAAYSSPPDRQPQPLYDGAVSMASLSSISAMVSVSAFSVPPGADGAVGLGLGGMVEPSAPMLLEPTAPELPQDWDMHSPTGPAFPIPMPMPMQYDESSAPAMSPYDVMSFAPLPPLPAVSPYDAMGFVLPPPPMARPNHGTPYLRASLPPVPGQPPRLPEKPRPSLPNAARPTEAARYQAGDAGPPPRMEHAKVRLSFQGPSIAANRGSGLPHGPRRPPPHVCGALRAPQGPARYCRPGLPASY
ncbi:hypothetical protein IWQ57_003438 [Coemansia nantahalensis]|uniref:Uncharacterized protein n=1 Tax=Coemansia nantahalensis TaxID=2789366 RepID=A0ACC1JW50_9FUNG|nr:hypothetical protein IWQ57_003438 [Coemansia nantahalensis]